MINKNTFLQFLYLLNRLFSSPLEALFTLLIFILSKELNATPLQLTIFAAAKPATSLVAFYLNAWMSKHKPNDWRFCLIGLSLLGCFPALLFPFMQNSWSFVLSYVIFMITLRASYPLWIEVLKNNFCIKNLGKICSKGSSINYLMIIILPFILSSWMDHNTQIWKKLFFICGFLQFFTSIPLFFLPNNPFTDEHLELSKEKTSLNPLKESWHLLKTNTSFTRYLVVFFLGGFGIVAMQPILPIFFKDALNLSYKELAIAFSVCKGLSFILSTPFWTRLINQISIFRLNVLVNTFSCLFILGIFCSPFQLHALFVAYIFYGTMQAGCELSWNISSPLFAKSDNSQVYSRINLALVGIRGVMCPLIGQQIFLQFNAFGVFYFAIILCLLSLVYAYHLDNKKSVTSQLRVSA